MNETRYAVVRGHRSVSEVEAYLPSNYEVVREMGSEVLISGVDRAGWTLEDYVIPRFS